MSRVKVVVAVFQSVFLVQEALFILQTPFMSHRYTSKDNWLVKSLAGAAFGACSFFYLLEGSLFENLGYYSQSAQAICPDYMRTRGGCEENGFGSESPFGAFDTDSPESINSDRASAAPNGDDSGSQENSSDVSVAVTSLTEVDEGLQSVSIGDMSISEVGRNISETIGENTISVSFETPLGYAVNISLSINEETNTVTAVRSVNENITEVSLSITETEEGMTMSVTSVDINGIESTKNVEAQVNEDGSLSFYSVEEDGTKSFISTTQQTELGLGLPERGILGTISDAVMGVVDAVVGAVNAAVDAVAGFLGLSAPEGFNEDGLDGDSQDPGVNDTTDAESSDIGNSIGDPSVDAAESDSGSTGGDSSGASDSGASGGNADGGTGDTGSDGVGGGGTSDGDGGSGGDSGGDSGGGDGGGE
jgi:hypothetical protein